MIHQPRMPELDPAYEVYVAHVPEVDDFTFRRWAQKTRIAFWEQTKKIAQLHTAQYQAWLKDNIHRFF